ncbi:hypothetical protein GCM10010260_03620 [Streptomyces filipinensis]|uniref:MmyB-like transcription regulator ligand binding domain-containing protein n=1 Tax=Streptomyces filipinensis TaxID=66887 RepID=A0A918I4R1_9ACTN|nr:hypothetical protein [Streptomyces filipinensis]GGU74969.1 hypothetical protein GCM10010260_03620 [Streptomyces filipinensis]
MRARYTPVSRATGSTVLRSCSPRPSASAAENLPPPGRAPSVRRLGRGRRRHGRASPGGGRAPSGPPPDVTGAVGELVVGSGESAALGQRYEVRSRTNGREHFAHPAMGTMTLSHEAHEVARTDGHGLVVYQAEPGSPDHEAMVPLGHADPAAVTAGSPRPG